MQPDLIPFPLSFTGLPSKGFVHCSIPSFQKFGFSLENFCSTEKQGILESSHTCLWAEIVEWWLFCMSTLANGWRKIKPLLKPALLFFSNKSETHLVLTVFETTSIRLSSADFADLRTDFRTRIYLVFHIRNLLASGQGGGCRWGEGTEPRARSMYFHDSWGRRELNAIHLKLKGLCLYQGSISGFQPGVLSIPEKNSSDDCVGFRQVFDALGC